jgi:hypothetical protein
MLRPPAPGILRAGKLPIGLADDHHRGHERPHSLHDPRVEGLAPLGLGPRRGPPSRRGSRREKPGKSRLVIDARVDERSLRELYLTAFECALAPNTGTRAGAEVVQGLRPRSLFERPQAREGAQGFREASPRPGRREDGQLHPRLAVLRLLGRGQEGVEGRRAPASSWSPSTEASIRARSVFCGERRAEPLGAEVTIARHAYGPISQYPARDRRLPRRPCCHYKQSTSRPKRRSCPQGERPEHSGELSAWRPGRSMPRLRR